MSAVVLERAVDKSEIVQRSVSAGSGARGIPPPGKIRRRQLNPDGKLIMVGNEVHVLETQMLDCRRRAIPNGQSRSISIIHKSFHHKILDASDRARAGVRAAVERPSIVHGHGETVFDRDMTAAAEVIGIVMVLLLAVDDLYVARGEILAAGDMHGPIGGSEEQKTLEGDVTAVVDHIASDSISMRDRKSTRLNSSH